MTATSAPTPSCLSRSCGAALSDDGQGLQVGWRRREAGLEEEQRGGATGANGLRPLIIRYEIQIKSRRARFYNPSVRPSLDSNPTNMDNIISCQCSSTLLLLLHAKVRPSRATHSVLNSYGRSSTMYVLLATEMRSDRYKPWCGAASHGLVLRR